MSSRSTSGRYVASADRSRRQALRSPCTPPGSPRRTAGSRAATCCTWATSQRCSNRRAGSFLRGGAGGSDGPVSAPSTSATFRVTALRCTSPAARTASTVSSSSGSPSTSSTSHSRQVLLPASSCAGWPVTRSSASSARTRPSGPTSRYVVRRVRIRATGATAMPRVPARDLVEQLGRRRLGPLARRGVLLAPRLRHAGGQLEVPARVRAAGAVAQRHAGAEQDQPRGVVVGGVQLGLPGRLHPGDRAGPGEVRHRGPLPRAEGPLDFQVGAGHGAPVPGPHGP